MNNVKVKDGENLSASNIERVISLLNQEKPITKKAACEILNISYNTARLTKIINGHTEKLAYDIKRRKQIKKQPLTDADCKYMVESYLSGDALSLISEATFRSTSVIKNVLSRYGIPLRDSSHDYRNPPLIDENFVKKDYVRNDLVYSARYGCPAYIEKSYQDDIHEMYYRIRLVGPYRQQALQPYYELIDLRNLQKELNVVLKEMSDDEIKIEINQTLLDAKRKKKRNDS